jgi:putative Holliday junction resolvase
MIPRSNNTRLLGIDVGSVRVGLALALDNRISPLEICKKSQGAAERKILRTIEELNIQALVIGLPLSEDNSESLQCQTVKAFAQRLSKRTDVPIMFQDEYLSSAEAQERASRHKDNTRHIDDIAACIILERYLAQIKRGDGLKF